MPAATVVMGLSGAHKLSKDLISRILSALVLIPVVLAAIYYGTPYFEVLIGVGAVILVWEWFILCDKRMGWLMFGIVYIALPSLALVIIRTQPELGMQSLIWLFSLVWSMDIGAYAFGKTIGGPKLAPSISPNKTWAGLIGGMICAGAVGAVCSLVYGLGDLVVLIIASALLGAFSQVGDLIESSIKRRFDKKDSGTIIPGHGGLFDRVDGLMAAALVPAFINLAGWGNILAW